MGFSTGNSKKTTVTAVSNEVICASQIQVIINCEQAKSNEKRDS